MAWSVAVALAVAISVSVTTPPLTLLGTVCGRLCGCHGMREPGRYTALRSARATEIVRGRTTDQPPNSSNQIVPDIVIESAGAATSSTVIRVDGPMIHRISGVGR